MGISAEAEIFLALGVTALTKGVAFYFLSKQYKGPQTVGTVSGLKIYPIKSGPCVDVSSLHCDFDGLRHEGVGDRQWTLCDANGKTVTGRNEGSLLFLKLSIHKDDAHVDVEGMPTLVLPSSIQKDKAIVKNISSVYQHKIQGVDCGDNASVWINKYLKKPAGTYRLLFSPPWFPKCRVLDGPSSQHKRAEDMDLSLYQNMCAGTLLSESSLQDLVPRVPVKITEANFRANIILSGAPPFDEDEYIEVQIGNVVMKKLKCTDRCITTTINPQTGIMDPNEEPLKTLRKYRMLPGYVTPCFCISLLTRVPGVIKVGDEVKVIRG